MQVGGDRPQHEAQDEQVEAVHRVADGGGGKRFPGGGIERTRAVDGIGMDGGHRVPLLDRRPSLPGL